MATSTMPVRAPVKACARAVSSSSLLGLALHHRCSDQEGVATGTTDALDSQMSLAIAVRQREFTIELALAIAVNVAALTRRHEILGIIVAGISVDMISDQRSRFRTTTRYPLHRFAAPMARMSSRTDLFVEDDAMLGQTNPSPWRDQRMPRALDISIGRGRHADRVHQGVWPWRL